MKAQLEADLASPAIYGDKNKFRETEAAYKANTNDLQKANTEYETVFEKMMELEEKVG
jgi:ATP-binding cassette subfamily F protein 3